MRNYWLFQIIERHVPGIWYASLTHGLALQNYLGDSGVLEPNHKRAVRHLARLNKGDWVVAGFTKHHFGGYGRLETPLYKSNGLLHLSPGVLSGMNENQERMDCEWVALPFEDDRWVYVDAHELKSDGHDIDFTPGLPVKQINEASFFALKSMLDDAGATLQGGIKDHRRNGWGSIEHHYPMPEPEPRMKRPLGRNNWRRSNILRRPRGA